MAVPGTGERSLPQPARDPGLLQELVTEPRIEGYTMEKSDSENLFDQLHKCHANSKRGNCGVDCGKLSIRT